MKMPNINYSRVESLKGPIICIIYVIKSQVKYVNINIIVVSVIINILLLLLLLSLFL